MRFTTFASVVVAMASSWAFAQDATGFSSINISDSGVTGSGYTQLDYTSSAYYEVGTTVVLLQGNDLQSLHVVDQDDELASRGFVPGYVSGSLVANQVYEVLTAHYLNLTYRSSSPSSSGDLIDPNGYSLLQSDGSYSDATEYPPDQRVFTSTTEINFLDTYVIATSIPVATILGDGSLDGAVQSWRDNGDGTFTLTLSPLAYDFLADNGFVAVAAPLIFVPGVGEVVIAVGGAVVITIAVRELYEWWTVHKNDAPPNLPKPRDAPTGTKPIDSFRNPRLTHQQVEDVKAGVGNGPADWTGIDPQGDVITSDVNGNAVNHGPWRDYTNH